MRYNETFSYMYPMHNGQIEVTGIFIKTDISFLCVGTCKIPSTSYFEIFNQIFQPQLSFCAIEC